MLVSGPVKAMLAQRPNVNQLEHWSSLDGPSTVPLFSSISNALWPLIHVGLQCSGGLMVGHPLGFEKR